MTQQNERRQDRRIRKTKQNIQQALSDLMNEKPIQTITVRELTERADINRGTFYLHYTDISDLLSQMEEELLDDMTQALNRRDIALLRRDPSLKFIDMFQFLLEHAQLCRIVLEGRGEQVLLAAAMELMRESAFATWEEFYGEIDPHLSDRFFTFSIAGCIGLARRWLEEGCRESPEEMGRMCNDFANAGRSILGSETAGR